VLTVQHFITEYGIGGRSHALSGATHSGEDHDGKGLHYKKQDSLMRRSSNNLNQLTRKVNETGWVYNAFSFCQYPCLLPVCTG